jgi:hypothetical protein
VTNEDRTRALEDLGYTPCEAVFLCLAALHSGYFLRRQFGRFAGASRGYRDDLLIEKLLSNKHGQVYGSGKKRIIYHLCSRPFYSAIGEPNNRQRRERPPFAEEAKLMAFDCVLANQEHRYLATEAEKVGYFTGELGIKIDNLPTNIYSSRKTESTTDRYFVDKFPIFLETPSQEPVVSFCYVDEGVIATPGFETYLKQYMALFRALGRFQLVYVATKEQPFRLAEKMFYRFFDPRGATKQTQTNRPAHGYWTTFHSNIFTARSSSSFSTRPSSNGCAASGRSSRARNSNRFLGFGGSVGRRPWPPFCCLKPWRQRPSQLTF